MGKKRDADEVYVRRTADRKYKVICECGVTNRLFDIGNNSPIPSEPVTTSEVIAASEYAVFRGTDQLARIVKAQDGWRVVVATGESKFGRAISPVGTDAFRAVKDWAIKHFDDIAQPNLTARLRQAKGERG